MQEVNSPGAAACRPTGRVVVLVVVLVVGYVVAVSKTREKNASSLNS